MITPAGHRVLIKAVDFENTDETLAAARAAGLYVPDSEFEREQNAVTQGTVIAIGHSAWRAYDGDWVGWKAWCKVGDLVTYSKFKGDPMIDPDDNEVYLIINDDDIKAVITTESSDE